MLLGDQSERCPDRPPVPLRPPPVLVKALEQREPMEQPPPKENWFRDLKDGRMEALLKTEAVRLRVSGTKGQVFEAIELFEQWTGKAVDGEWRRPPRRGPRPMQGAISMDEIGWSAADDDQPTNLS